MARKSSRRGKRRKRSQSGGRLPLVLAAVLLVVAVVVLLQRTTSRPGDEAVRLPEAREAPVPERESAPPGDDPVQPSALPGSDAVQARAEQLVERLRQALNQGDAQAIAELSSIPPEVPDATAAGAALADYRRYFGESAVVRHVRSSSTNQQTSQGEDLRLVYELVGANGARKPVLAYYDARFDTLRLYDEFLRYSGRAHAYADAMVAALREGDPVELAALLSVDDLSYPTALARRALSRYDERFDRSTLRWSFSGLGPGASHDFNRPFLFAIRGEKAGAVQTHHVEVHAADGLLNWRDPLVPPNTGSSSF